MNFPDADILLLGTVCLFENKRKTFRTHTVQQFRESRGRTRNKLIHF